MQMKSTLVSFLGIHHPTFPLIWLYWGLRGFFLKIKREALHFLTAVHQNLSQWAAFNRLPCPGRWPRCLFIPTNTSLYSSNWPSSQRVTMFISMHSLAVSPAFTPPIAPNFPLWRWPETTQMSTLHFRMAQTEFEQLPSLMNQIGWLLDDHTVGKTLELRGDNL